MNLRNVTIGTTGAILLLTVVAIFATSFPLLIVSDFSTTEKSAEAIFVIIYFGSVLWLFSGLPAAVSFVVARKLKADIPAIILLASTTAYGFLFVYYGYRALKPDQLFGFLWYGHIVPISLWWMLPAWITALLVNRYYATKTPDPETAASTPSSPNLFDGGEQTQ